ncbi:redoxin family protein [bacterium]|nr:redoxin family protein [bacterium]
MKKLLVIMVIVSVMYFFYTSEDVLSEQLHNNIYDFEVKTIDGVSQEMSDFQGKTLLIVNVASKCGYTYQYKELQKLYEKYKDRGFTVLGFPSNDFLWQEPGSNKEIKKFCTLKYGVTFPMFEKISVTGRNRHPLYKFLTQRQTNRKFAGKITWNFNKFLIDDKGNIVDRFGTKDDPDSFKVIRAVKKLLKGKPVVKKTFKVDKNMKETVVPVTNKVSIVIDTLDGKKLDIGKMSYDRPILLNFWAVWCPYCVKELPHLSSFEQKYGDKIKVVGIAINYRESQSAVKRFVKKRNLNHTLGYDTDGILSQKYGVQGVPAFYLLKNGKAQTLGGIPEADAIEKLLEK